jgi:hypothetical protein
MAAFTTAQAGNWSDDASWSGSGVPGSGDTVTISHAIAVDVNTTCGGITDMTAALTVNAGIVFTLVGNAAQGNAVFTLSAGASLVFDTTAGDVKWTQGSASTTGFGTKANCRIVCAGTSGSHVTVSKTGANDAYFDEIGVGTVAETTGWDCDYTDFSGINNPANDRFNRLNSFGDHHIRFQNCTFDACGNINTNHFGWEANANKDYIIEDCRITNAVVAPCITIGISNTGSGTRSIKRNAFDLYPAINAVNCPIEDNLFEHSVSMNNVWQTCQHNLFQVGAGEPETGPQFSLNDCYWLAALNSPGNPHCFSFTAGSVTIENCIAEHPPVSAIDSGEFALGTPGSITVRNNLIIPNVADGTGLGQVCNYLSGTNAAWVMEHNTIVGEDTANGFQWEVGADPATPRYSSVKSNLCVDPANANGARITWDIGQPAAAQDDIVLAANATHNGGYGTADFTDVNNGSQVYDGYITRFSSGTPGANDVRGDPAFVDPTRCFSAWAVYKGAAVGGDTLAVKTEAAMALIRADPTLIRLDLMPWVRDGFRPTNAAYRDAGHDGVTIGALEGVWTNPPAGRPGVRSGGQLNAAGIAVGGAL